MRMPEEGLDPRHADYGSAAPWLIQRRLPGLAVTKGDTTACECRILAAPDPQPGAERSRIAVGDGTRPRWPGVTSQRAAHHRPLGHRDGGDLIVDS